MEERTLICRRCGKKHPPSNMRYFQDAKNLICVNCVEKIKNPSKAKETEDENEEKKKRRYKCTKCKHIFMIKDGFNKQCPFCAGFDITSQEWNSDLDTLINESSGKEFDR